MTTTIQESAAPARAVQSSASVPVSGLVDPADGHALVRVSGYRLSPADVYVSVGQIKQYGLRKGDRIEGTARPSAGGRAKYRPLVTVDTVNGMPPELARARPHFDDLTPLYPRAASAAGGREPVRHRAHHRPGGPDRQGPAWPHRVPAQGG